MNVVRLGERVRLGVMVAVDEGVTLAEDDTHTPLSAATAAAESAVLKIRAFEMLPVNVSPPLKPPFPFQPTKHSLLLYYVFAGYSLCQHPTTGSPL